MKKSIFIIFLLLAASLNAGVIRFRSGKIIAAEITGANVKIDNFDPHAFPAMPENRMYAVLSVKLDKGRAISIFDYSLEAFGTTCPCVAVNSGSGFRYTVNTLDGISSAQLLFVLDRRSIGKTESIKIKCNLPPTDGTYDLSVPFENRNYNAPSGLNELPASGVFGAQTK